MDINTWSADLLAPGSDGLTLLGQLGQSLDGQIATASGHSKYINGDSGLRHLHELRAWADVVVIGVGTLVADDPKLTVRMTEGRSPDRVVIDPRARSPAAAACLVDASVRRVVLTASDNARTHWPAGVEQAQLEATEPGQRLGARQVRRWIASQGWRRVLVEGGAATLAGFLQAGCLDYLHLITSPVILGPGTPGIRVQGLNRLADSQRFAARTFSLGKDILIQCSFQPELNHSMA